MEAHWLRMQTIHAVFQSDGAWFIARCLDLPVTTQGRTLAAAKKNLQERWNYIWKLGGHEISIRESQRALIAELETERVLVAAKLWQRLSDSSPRPVGIR